MILVKINQKGEYGYIKSKKTRQILTTAAIFLMAFTVFIVSYIVSGHTKKNVGTVLAIVTMLPACKALVGTILIFPYRTLEASIYDKIAGMDTGAILLYDLVLTSEQKPMWVSVAAVGDDRVYMYIDKKQDRKFIEKYFQKVMNAYCLDAEVFVTDDIKKFMKMSASIKKVSDNATSIKDTILVFGF